MATFYVNNVASNSTSMNTSASAVTRSTSYTAEITGIDLAEIDVYIYFYKSDKTLSSYTSSGTKTTTTWSIYGNQSSTYYQASNGEYSFANSAPGLESTYGNITGLKFEFYNVPSDVQYINVNLASVGSRYWYCKPPYSNVGSPKNLTLSGTLSREAVELSWDAGSAGTNNSVTGYDVQQRDSTDGVTFGNWGTASGSPVTGRTISVTPPETVGHYRQFRVRTRGSAGSSYYSGYVVLDTLLRRKWDDFGEWTDPTLTAKKSHIRAVLIAQIQERVNAIRAFYALQAYPFTEIVARSTHVSKWHILIGEIRSAIDEITTEHEGWFTLEPYKPRITHITQLRRIIDEM